MNRFLEEILSRRRERVLSDARLTSAEILAGRVGRPGPPPDPAPAIRQSGGFVVAEVKKASPSRGLLAEGVDVPARARAYERGGAGAVSVLCEPDFFRGSRDDVAAAAQAVSVPVLCKDFVVDPYQLLQARADGARWVLLIARVLGPDLARFAGEALALGLEPLVEVHTGEEMESAVTSGARLVGVNARDLDTFHVDLAVVKALAPLCPPSCGCIAESGIRGPGDLMELRDAGAHGFLIGEALMRSDDPEGAIKSYRSALGLVASSRGCIDAFPSRGFTFPGGDSGVQMPRKGPQNDL
jgi:indole-3-glycerol phosphate synthase